MEFVALKELVRTITPRKMRNIDILGYTSAEDAPLSALYEGIANGKISSDEEARVAILGAGASKKSYNALRSRLIRQLINSAFLVDPHHVWQTDRLEAYHHCLMDIAAANVPSLRNTSLVVVELLERVIQYATKYEFPYMGADAARLLRLEYGRMQSDPQKHNYYAGLHRKFEHARQWDVKAWDYHENLIHYYIHRSIPDKEIYKKAAAYFEELHPHLSTVDTSEYYHKTYEIGMIQHFAINDCRTVFNLCDELLGIIRDRPNSNRSHVMSALFQKILCIIQLNDFDVARDRGIIEECMSYVEISSYNWYKAMELRFVYHIYTRQYAEALGIYCEVTAQPRFTLLQGKLRDTWELYGGYLHLLAAFGKFPGMNMETIVGSFKYSKFINNILVIPSEKEGMNIPIVFLPILFGLKMGTLHENWFSREAFIKYKRRYLDNELNVRSSAFANLLLALSNDVYKSVKTPRIINRELEVLRQHKSAVSRQTTVVEVIPYEHLWEMLIAPH
jgi:hypothetical protein